MALNIWCNQCKEYVESHCRKHYKRASTCNDIAERNEEGQWTMLIWLLPESKTFAQWKRSTFGHYYHVSNWHPLAVNQRTYVMDDFGNLVLVYDDI